MLLGPAMDTFEACANCRANKLTLTSGRERTVQDRPCSPSYNILCGVNTFRKLKEVKLRENLRLGSFGTVAGPILRQPDWLILVIGPLN